MEEGALFTRACGIDEEGGAAGDIDEAMLLTKMPEAESEA